MQRICSHCGSANVRRSGIMKSEASIRFIFSPYRCRDCGERFWVFSKKACVSAVAGVSIIATGVFVWAMSGVLAYRDSSPARSASAPPVTVPVPGQQSFDAATKIEMNQLSDTWLKGESGTPK